MCNRFKLKLQAAMIRDLMSTDVTVLPEAEHFSPHDDVRPSTETLAIWEQDGAVVLGTVFWGFHKLPSMGKGLVINARSERLDSSPFWRDTVRCWLPATAWIEYVVEDRRTVPREVALADGSPFLIAGVCGVRAGVRRMAMCMQDAPAPLAYLCDRLPLPYAFSAIAAREPRQLIGQMVVHALTGS
jgi:putative SOS response-associated peptidase YedK